MKTYFLSLFNTGQVTLPKKWRDKHKTKKFIAVEKGEDLLIKPYMEIDEDHPLHDNNVTLREYDDGAGITFKKGVDPKLLADLIDEMYGQD